jgi:O-antigen/teichoic acid export membrane protein
LNLLTRYQNGLHQGTHNFGRFNAVRISVHVAYLAGLIVLAIGHLQDIYAVLLITLLSNVVALLVAAAGFPFRGLWPKLDGQVMHSILAFGARSHLGNLTPLDSMRLDLAIVVLYLPATEAGTYAVAISIALLVRAQGTALGMIALPVGANAENSEDRLQTLGGIFRLALILNVTTAFLVVITAPTLVPIVFGEDFRPAILIAQVLVIGAVAASLRQVLGDSLRGMGRPFVTTAIELLALLVAAVAFAVLVPPYGAVGAAAAASLTYGIALAMAVWAAARAGLPPRALFGVSRRDVQFLGAVVGQLAGTRVQSLRLVAASDDAKKPDR